MADDTTSSTGTTTSESTPPATGATTTATTPPATQTAAPSGDIPPEVARALHKANKEAEQYRLKLKEFEDREKTEAQKLAERATEAEKVAADAKAELMKYQVAAQKNIPASLAARLQGSTPEELAADADRMLADLALHQQATAPSFDGGVRETAPGPTDMNARIRQMANKG